MSIALRSLFAVVIASTALGCTAPSEEVRQDESAALTAPAPSRWFTGTFEGPCTRSWGPPKNRTLEIFFRDDRFVVREPPVEIAEGVFAAIDTTILDVKVAPDGTFFEKYSMPYDARFEGVNKGACGADRCEILNQTTIDDHDVGHGSFTLTRTPDGVGWQWSYTTVDDDEAGVIQGAKPYTEAETCQLRRVR